VTDVGALLSSSVDLQGARAIFSAFGTCSITEPIEGLIELGLLDE
jgi:hypothetical protein